MHESILRYAKASFGLVVPEHLKDQGSFDQFELREDALLRIEYVEDEFREPPSQNRVFFIDSVGCEGAITLEELSHYEGLDVQWRKLVPVGELTDD